MISENSRAELKKVEDAFNLYVEIISFIQQLQNRNKICARHSVPNKTNYLFHIIIVSVKKKQEQELNV